MELNEEKYLLMVLMIMSINFTSAGNFVGKCENETRGNAANCLLGKLLTGYDKRLRPNFTGPPLSLKVEILLSNVFGVSEVKNEFGVEIYFRQFWNDPRLRLSQFNYTKSLFLNTESIDEVWIPSTFFVKSKRAFRHHITTDNVLLRIKPNGDIFYSQRLSVVTSCIMDLRYFPHDTQVCRFLIESYAYQDSDIVYSWGTIMQGAFKNIKDDSFDIPSYKIAAVKLSEGQSQYSIGNHSHLLATFIFNRRVGFFLIETYIPSCIVVIISWVSFWIPPESAPARVSLGITTILTMTTISSATRQSLPKVSYVKVVDWFLLACLLFVFAALLEYAFVVYYNSKQKEKDLIVEEMESIQQEREKLLRTTILQLDVSDGNSEHDSKSTSSKDFEAWIGGNADSLRKKKKKTMRKKLLSDILVIPTKIDAYARKGFPMAFIMFIGLYCTNVTLARH